MNRKNINIESYEGADAYYTGSDEEYEEFLKNSDAEPVAAEPVENTQKINLNETINLQSVIDKFKKTAGGIESGARKLRDTVVTKMDEFKAKKENAAAKNDGEKESIKEKAVETIKEKAEETVKETAKKIEDFRGSVEDLANISDKFQSVEQKIQTLQADTVQLSGNFSEKMEAISKKLDDITAREKMRMGDNEKHHSDMKRTLNEMTSDIADIKQAVNSVSKLNDSVFDLKNAQLNTKKTLSDVTASVTRLRKKCVLGITVLSILSAITIVLEVVLMLS